MIAEYMYIVQYMCTVYGPPVCVKVLIFGCCFIISICII